MIKHIDHIGVVVNDLEAAKQFFIDLGFTSQGEDEGRGELLDNVVGAKGARSQIVFMATSNGEPSLS